MNHFKFSTGQIVVLSDLASIGPLQLDDRGCYSRFVLTYQKGAVVTISEPETSQAALFTFRKEYDAFIEAVAT